jgi:hypothetical protein
VKELDDVLLSVSRTDMVIVPVPNWLAAGLIVTVLSKSLTLVNRMFPFGTKPGFEELPVKIRSLAGVVASLIWKLIGPIGTSSLFVNPAGIGGLNVIVGAPATMPIFTTNELEAMPPLASMTVNVIVKKSRLVDRRNNRQPGCCRFSQHDIRGIIRNQSVGRMNWQTAIDYLQEFQASLIVNDCGVAPSINLPGLIDQSGDGGIVVPGFTGEA